MQSKGMDDLVRTKAVRESEPEIKGFNSHGNYISVISSPGIGVQELQLRFTTVFTTFNDSEILETEFGVE